MKVTGAGKEWCRLLFIELHQEKSIPINTQVSRIIGGHGAAGQMHGVNGANADSKPNLLGVHAALAAIHRSSNPGYRLAHNILKHNAS
ncbi:hypothetical protein D3C73_1185750 [compost metagenome]